MGSENLLYENVLGNFILSKHFNVFISRGMIRFLRDNVAFIIAELYLEEMI